MLKVFDLPTDKGLPILATLTAEIGEMLLDKELFNAFTNVAEKFKDRGNLSKSELVTVGLTQIIRLVPILIKNHPNNMYNIISTLKEISVEEVKQQKVSDTVKDVISILKDEGFRDFFTSFIN